MSTISISIAGPVNQQQTQVMQSFMNATAAFHNDEVERLQRELNISAQCAMDVSYLRTRSRHTPELEKRLIAEHREGKVILVCDWPKHSDNNYNPFTGEALRSKT